MTDCAQPAPIEFRTSASARLAGLLLALSWLAAAVYVVGDRLSQDGLFQAWWYSLGFAVLGTAVGEALRKTRAALRIDSEGLRLRTWIWSRRVKWGAMAAVLRRERLAVSPYGLPGEETEIILGGPNGSRILVVPGSVGTLAAGKLEELLLARGFTKVESEGSQASWLLVGPGASAGARTLRAPDGPYRVKLFASHCLTALPLVSAPFGALAGWCTGSMSPALRTDACACVAIGAILGIVSAFAASLNRELGTEGRLRTQLVLLALVVLAIGSGYGGGVYRHRYQLAFAQREADAILAALESYHQSSGEYPLRLDLMTPRMDYTYEIGDDSRSFQYQARADTGHKYDSFELVYTVDWRTYTYDSWEHRWVVRSR